MKVIGAALVFVSFMTFGIARIYSIKKRIDTVSSLVSALELMEGELETSLCSLEELLFRLSLCSEASVKVFFSEVHSSMDRLGAESFGEIWAFAAKSNFAFLSDDLMAELIRLGYKLGKFELDRQLSAIEACRCAFCKVGDRERYAFTENKKMSLAIPAVSAVFLIILMV